MKRLLILLTTTCLLLFSAFMLQGQATFKVKSNKMSVQGTSSLHDWESEITKAEWKGSFVTEKNTLIDIKDIEVKIPVESIKSTKGKIMDNKTYDAFKYEKFPYIMYAVSTVHIDAATGTIHANGKLTMAGVTKPVEVTAKYKVLGTGELQIAVSQKLKMTDFKMDPPTAMMGAIKVGDEVTVSFDLVLTSTKSIL